MIRPQRALRLAVVVCCPLAEHGAEGFELRTELGTPFVAPEDVFDDLVEALDVAAETVVDPHHRSHLVPEEGATPLDVSRVTVLALLDDVVEREFYGGLVFCENRHVTVPFSVIAINHFLLPCVPRHKDLIPKNKK